MRVIFGLGRDRVFGEVGIRDKAFIAGGGANLHVAFHAVEDLDLIAAFQFGFDVEIDEGFVHPDAIVVRSATDADGGRGAGLRSSGRGGGAEDGGEKEFVSHWGLLRISMSRAAHGASGEPSPRASSAWAAAK
jgi:hypothetical protein